tara:strand:+ start:42 stop:314 length:273 start_codon:yes stop_codon:yes gene_type:complete
MAKIIVNDEETNISPEESLKEPLEDAGVPFCCEEGVCGTCVIEVEKGMEHLTPFTEEESDFLGELDTERLACQCKIREKAEEGDTIHIKC